MGTPPPTSVRSALPTGNPYLAVRARQRQNRQASGLGWALALATAAVITPLARPVILGFLDSGAVARGVEGISVRLGALVGAIVILHSYGALVRSPDRAVLDAHPVQPRLLLAAVGRDVLRDRSWLVGMAAILLLPVGLAGHWVPWLGAVTVVAGAWVAALGVGLCVHLGGVWAAHSPGLARVLDAIRGANPRMQAALIYAPAAALFAVGVLVALASGGLGQALSGWTPGYALLAVPFVAGGLGYAAAGPLADREYVRATAILTEVDALYAGVDEAEEGHRVYLDWLAADRLELLLALRLGWRDLRSWATGAWLLGLPGALAGWTASPDAPARVLAVTGAAVVLLGALPVRMSANDPRWLDRALGVRRTDRFIARGLVAWLYAQGAVIPALSTLALRHEGALEIGVYIEITALVAAGLGAVLGHRLRDRGVWAYAPLGMLLWVALNLVLAPAAPA